MRLSYKDFRLLYVAVLFFGLMPWIAKAFQDRYYAVALYGLGVGGVVGVWSVRFWRKHCVKSAVPAEPEEDDT